MTAKKRGLGRGLDALIGAGIMDTPATERAGATEQAGGEFKHLPIEQIRGGRFQPRREIEPEALEELANSIRAQGVMQPIVVRPAASGYEIIAGERRWRASQLAGLDTIPVVIKHVPDDAAIAMALIENIQRENLNPVEEAYALQRLQQEFDLTHQGIADAVGKSRTTVTNLLRLMSLNAEVRTMLEHGDLEMGHARALLTLPLEQQTDVAKTIVDKSLSVRQTESLVRRLHKPMPGSNASSVARTADIRQLEEQLSEKVGVPIRVQHTAKGKGKLIFKYNSLDELDGILSHIN